MSIRTDKKPRRPASILLIFLLILGTVNLALFISSYQRRNKQKEITHLYDIAAAGIGLTDLCISTEARYTRHPAVSDPVVPFMDYPGAIEHFPTGSFWAPPENLFKLDGN